MDFASRVKETSTTTGTGTLDLDGALDGTFQTFVSGVGDGATVYYVIVNQDAAEWETGIGTVTDAATDTLARDTVLESSNSGSAVDFSAGTKHVFLDVVGERPPGHFLLGSGSVSGASSLDIVLPGGFSRYKVKLDGALPASDGNALHGLVSSDGGSTFDNASGDYMWVMYKIVGTGSEFTDGSTSSTVMELVDFIENETTGSWTEGVSGVLEIRNPHDASKRTHFDMQYTKRENVSGGRFSHGRQTGMRDAAQADDAIRIEASGSNLDVTRYALYGVL